jgi:hypothetical protein|tara:strand:- start:55 stop:327 length:273 start_codon:yes stop_codon:yes gene_type:complete
MILITYGVQEGEREYYVHEYSGTFTYIDYINHETTNNELLEDWLGDDLDDDNWEDPTDGTYWDDTRLVWVENVYPLSDVDRKILNKFSIL